VTERRLDIAGFADGTGSDLAWAPPQGLSATAMRGAVTSRSAAPGGWLILSHSKFGGAPVKDAVTTLHAAIIAACHQTRRTLVPAH
jgi:hypothetical protein